MPMLILTPAVIPRATTISMSMLILTPTIIPRANIFMLGNAARKSPSDDAVIFRQALDAIEKILSSVQEGGYILEEYFWEWLKLRLKVARRCPQYPLTFGKLLAVDEDGIELYPELIKSVLKECFHNIQSYAQFRDISCG